MCGILGAIYGPSGPHESDPSPTEAGTFMFPDLVHRGRDSFGWATYNDSKGLVVEKYPMAGNQWNCEDYLAIPDDAHYWLGHVRFGTHGPETFHGNNHPIVHKQWVCVHNGVIDNYQRILRRTGREDERAQVDSEAIPAAIAKWGLESGLTSIVGAAAVALVNSDEPGTVYLARTDGSPMSVATTKAGTTYFASEKQTLVKLAKKYDLEWLPVTKDGSGIWSPQDYSYATYVDGVESDYRVFRSRPPKNRFARPKPKRESTWAPRSCWSCRVGVGEKHRKDCKSTSSHYPFGTSNPSSTTTKSGSTGTQGSSPTKVKGSPSTNGTSSASCGTDTIQEPTVVVKDPCRECGAELLMHTYIPAWETTKKECWDCGWFDYVHDDYIEPYEALAEVTGDIPASLSN